MRCKIKSNKINDLSQINCFVYNIKSNHIDIIGSCCIICVWTILRKREKKQHKRSTTMVSMPNTSKNNIPLGRSSCCQRTLKTSVIDWWASSRAYEYRGIDRWSDDAVDIRVFGNCGFQNDMERRGPHGQGQSTSELVWFGTRGITSGNQRHHNKIRSKIIPLKYWYEILLFY